MRGLMKALRRKAGPPVSGWWVEKVVRRGPEA
jgi:hypothetical protein